MARIRLLRAVALSPYMALVAPVSKPSSQARARELLRRILVAPTTLVRGSHPMRSWLRGERLILALASRRGAFPRRPLPMETLAPNSQSTMDRTRSLLIQFLLRLSRFNIKLARY